MLERGPHLTGCVALTSWPRPGWLTSGWLTSGRSQVSLAGGADRIPGGGINLNTYTILVTAKGTGSLGGAQICPGG